MLRVGIYWLFAQGESTMRASSHREGHLSHAYTVTRFLNPAASWG